MFFLDGFFFFAVVNSGGLLSRAQSVGAAVRNCQIRLWFPWSHPCDFTNQNGNQYTLRDYEDGQNHYPPPMTEHTIGYDHDVPGQAEDTEDTPLSKKRRYN